MYKKKLKHNEVTDSDYSQVINNSLIYLFTYLVDKENRRKTTLFFWIRGMKLLC